MSLSAILIWLSTPLCLLNHKKLSCRREAARCFMSLNILLSYSRSLKIIRNGTIWWSSYWQK